MSSLLKIFAGVNYWSIVLLPLAIAIAPAPMSIFMGFLIFTYLARKIIQRGAFLVPSKLLLALLGLFIIACLSIFNSIDFPGSLRGGILRLLMYILLFLAVAEGVKQKKHLARITISAIAGMILLSIDAIWQVRFGRDFIHGYPSINNIELIRATASFKDANLLGIYLSAFSPLAFGLALYYFKGKKRIILLLSSLLILSAIALTYSRPTLLAVYLALFFLGIVRKDRALIICLTILLLISPFLLPKQVKLYARQVRFNPLIFMCNEDRIAIFRNTIRMIQAHPVLGVGANASMKTYRYYKEKPEFRNVVTVDEAKAHNNFLQMAAETGFIGLAFFILFLFYLFYSGAAIYQGQRDHYLKVVTLSLIACLIAFLINGLTESSLFYSRVAPVFWYLCGLLIAVRQVHCEK